MLSTRAHGALDYASALALFIVPRALGWDRKVRRLTDLAAIGTVAYAQATRYELGSAHLLDMKRHRVIDAAQGLAALAVSASLRDQPPHVRWSLAGYGLFTLVATALTEPRAYSGSPMTDTGRRTSSGAWVMYDEDREMSDEDTLHLPDTPPAGRQRTNEYEWRQAQGPEFRRHVAEVGRGVATNGQGKGRMAEIEWRQARAPRSFVQLGQGTHQTTPHLSPHELRRGPV